jgi:hypothetical protein
VVLQLANSTYALFIDLCVRGEKKELLRSLDTARAEFEALCRSAETKMIAERVVPGQRDE